MTFYFEDDDHKPVDFNNETISFTCQLIKIKKKCTHIYVFIFSIHNCIRVYEYFISFK